MTVYYGRNGRSYQVENEIKSGGEGSICKIAGMDDKLAKIYTKADDAERARLKAKILAMLDKNYNPYHKGHMIVAWPVDILLDAPNGKCCGLVMPYAKGMETITCAKRESDAKKLFPHYDRTYGIRVAHNLCNVVEILHSQGFIIGDLNPNNLLLDGATRQVTIVDSDSFQFSDAQGNLHRCAALRPDFVAPELQGKSMLDIRNNVTRESDCFSLALHVFELLNNYSHPFCCQNVNPNQSSSSRPTREDNILKGRTPYVSGSTQAIQRSAPDQTIFTPAYRELLDRAFGYTVDSAVKKETLQRRPTAAEWRAVLEDMLKEWTGDQATHCADATHVYPRRYNKPCPWCNIQHRRQHTAPDIRADGTPVPATSAVPAAPVPTPAAPIPVKPAVAPQTPVYTPVKPETQPRPEAARVKTTKPRPVPTPPPPPTPERGAFLLYAICILLALAGSIWCAPGIADMLDCAQNFVVVVSVITGLVSGIGVAMIVEDDYCWADTSWPYLLWSFAGIAAAALLTTAITFVVHLFV